MMIMVVLLSHGNAHDFPTVRYWSPPADQAALVVGRGLTAKGSIDGWS
jgi:hypothetical protein